MNIDLPGAQLAIQNARAALRSGDRTSARRFAEQAAKLAPQLIDSWLILASVSSPRESMAYIERALQINPENPRALKGKRWAQKRLQKMQSARHMSANRKQVKRVKRSASHKKSGWRQAALPIVVLTLGCMIILAMAWTGTSLAMASILGGDSQANAHQKAWARVVIAKPTNNSEPTSSLAVVEPTLAPPQPDLPAPTEAPAVMAIQEPTTAPSHIPTAVPSQVPAAAPTQVPVIAPTQEPAAAPTLEPTSVPALAPPTTTLEAAPSVIPEATSTSSGTLAMEIIINTPVPTPQPTNAYVAPTVQAPVGNGVHWIEVNLTDQRVYAWAGDVLMRTFIVSTGTWQTPTVVGTYSIWNKTRIQTMSGPGYSLPNVPFVMYFYKGYGFHGTYWHNNFGTPMSHGCVNLTMLDSEWLYNFAYVGTTVKVHY